MLSKRPVSPAVQPAFYSLLKISSQQVYFFEALTLQSSTSMRIKSILNTVLCGKISLVLKCCSLTIKVQIKAMVYYSNSSPSCQNRHFAQMSTSVRH